MDADYTALTSEYHDLTHARELSDRQADRMDQLLELACEDPTFAVLTNEVDEALFRHNTFSQSAKTHADNQIAIVKEFVLKAAPAPALGLNSVRVTDDGRAGQTQTLLDYYQLSTQRHLSKRDIVRVAELLQIASSDVYLNLLKTDLESDTLKSLYESLDLEIPDRADSRDITFKIQGDRINQLAMQQHRSSRRMNSFLTYAGFLIAIATSALFLAAHGPSIASQGVITVTPDPSETADPAAKFNELSKVRISKGKIKDEAESTVSKTPRETDKALFLRAKAWDRDYKTNRLKLLLTLPYKAKASFRLSSLDLWGNANTTYLEGRYELQKVESADYLQYQERKRRL